jgi:4-hydroxybenzoyl-CoA reductase subunit beta
MMRLPKFEYISPTTVDEALVLLNEADPKGMIMGGGTDLLVAAKLRNIQPIRIISLKRVNKLKGITYQEGDGLKIGAMTPLHQVRQDSNVKTHYEALALAASVVGSPQIQRMGTIGGNICLNTRCFFYNQSLSWRKHRPACIKMGGIVCHVVPKRKRCFAVFSADTPPALLALDAKVKLVSGKGERLVPIKEFYTGDGKQPTTLNQGEILTEILLPPVTKQDSIYLKHRIRKAIDFPLVGVAVKLLLNERKDTCIEAKIVLNAVGPAPIVVSEAETLLRDSLLDHGVIIRAGNMAAHVAHPVANIDSTPTHRRELAGLLTQKALEILVKESKNM